jgi:NAD(P)-dependent dehydrogenase (short-subunit alcohol dehydrogenase family)
MVAARLLGGVAAVAASMGENPRPIPVIARLVVRQEAVAEESGGGGERVDVHAGSSEKLARPQASYVTGAVLRIDGGYGA